MWTMPRMIALCAVTAFSYAFCLYLFNFFISFPLGLRPAVALALASGIMFGPAGAVGSGLGNFLFDIRNEIDFGTIPGIAGNFLLAYLPYRGIRLFKDFNPQPRARVTWILKYSALAALGALGCGLAIGFCLEGLRAAAFAQRGISIMIGNFAVALILGPVVLLSCEPLHKRGLTYADMMNGLPQTGKRQTIGWIMIIAGAAIAVLAAVLTYMGIIPPFAQYAVGSDLAPAAAPVMLAPMLIFLAGVFLV